jgi:hypothetical protein
MKVAGIAGKYLVVVEDDGRHRRRHLRAVTQSAPHVQRYVHIEERRMCLRNSAAGDHPIHFPSTLFVRRMSDATANNKIATPGNSDSNGSSGCKFLTYSNLTAAAHFGISIALTLLDELIPKRNTNPK